MRRQWIASNQSDDIQQSTTFIEWCNGADDWGDEPTVVEENGNVIGKSEAMEMCASTSAELETLDADDNVIVEPIDLPNIDVLQLLDSRKEIPSVSQYNYFIIYILFQMNLRAGILDNSEVK